jgi:preprotein translocase subunit SecB
MKINHTNIRAKNINLHDYGLKGHNFKINPKYYKKITKLENDSYRLELFIDIKNTKENPFPIDLSVDFETTFSFADYESDDEIKKFLNINAVQMIFPFMRSAINSVVSSALLPPLVLPIIDVRQFKEKI